MVSHWQLVGGLKANDLQRPHPVTGSNIAGHGWSVTPIG